jgi:HEAT repeat protein
LRVFPFLCSFFLFLLSTGCTGFWDEVTSRDFRVKNWFIKPDPLVVLRDNPHDGDKREKALRALREPEQHGGTQRDQDAVVQILTAAAATERRAICRIAAIESLSHFKDPRAVQGLVEAYYKADPIHFRQHGFPPEQATQIQCAAIKALGETGNPAALELLVRVVAEPPPAEDQVIPAGGKRLAEDTYQETLQQSTDRRIAAARALGQFKQYQATEALLSVLQREKDVALRNRANESLQQATGKKLPPDPKAWEPVLHHSGDGKSDVQQVKHKVLGLF